MEAIVDEILGTYIGPYASPGLFLAGAVAFGVLLTGLAARIVELGQTITDGLADHGTSGLSPMTPPR